MRPKNGAAVTTMKAAMLSWMLQPSVNLAVNAVASTGGNQPHENRQPYLGMTYIIALEGIFPSRP